MRKNVFKNYKGGTIVILEYKLKVFDEGEDFKNIIKLINERSIILREHQTGEKDYEIYIKNYNPEHGMEGDLRVEGLTHTLKEARSFYFKYMSEKYAHYDYYNKCDTIMKTINGPFELENVEINLINIIVRLENGSIGVKFNKEEIMLIYLFLEQTRVNAGVENLDDIIISFYGDVEISMKLMDLNEYGYKNMCEIFKKSGYVKICGESIEILKNKLIYGEGNRREKIFNLVMEQINKKKNIIIE